MIKKIILPSPMLKVSVYFADRVPKHRLGVLKITEVLLVFERDEGNGNVPGSTVILRGVSGPITLDLDNPYEDIISAIEKYDFARLTALRTP